MGLWLEGGSGVGLSWGAGGGGDLRQNCRWIGNQGGAVVRGVGPTRGCRPAGSIRVGRHTRPVRCVSIWTAIDYVRLASAAREAIGRQ